MKMHDVKHVLPEVVVSLDVLVETIRVFIELYRVVVNMLQYCVQCCK